MSKAKAVKAISLLWLASLIGAGCAFLTQVILARSLGPQEFGLFASAFAMVSLLVPLAGFGLAQYWLKEFGKDGFDAIRFIKPSFRFILANLVFVFILLLLWIALGPHDKTVQMVLLIMSVYILGQVSVELVSSKLQLEERFNALAVWQLMPHLMRLLLVFAISLWFESQFNVKVVAYLFALVALLFVMLSIKPLSKIARGQFALKGHDPHSMANNAAPPLVKDILKNAWPFGLAGVFHLIYFQSDIILVKYITGDEAAGYYNVAFTIMVAVLLFPGIVYQKFLLPKMHRWAHHDRALFYKVYRQGNVAMFILGLLAMVLIWLLLPIAIPLLFGDKYKEAITLLNILAISAPILFVASSVGATLVTQEHMKTKVKLMGLVAIVNILLNLALIPLYGAGGAAFATVISNLILLIIYYVSVKLYVFRAS